MKKFLIYLSIILTILIISLVTLMKLYIPTGSILLKTQGRAGNQLFQYAAAYSLAKETDSKLFLIVNTNEAKAGYTKSQYALGEFNIPKENIIYTNKYNRLYFKLIYDYYNNIFIKRLNKKILQIRYVGEINYFAYKKIKNDKIIVMDDYFESPVYFEKYKEELSKQYKIKNIDNKKLDKITHQITQKNSVCIHVRRGDMLFNDRLISIDFQKEAISLTQEIIDSPRFFIFSDDQNMVQKELSNVHNLEFIEGNTAIEDFYLMSHCRNNIITRSSFSWWAAYLNPNNGLVISPYQHYSEKFFRGIKDLNERYSKRSAYARSAPKNWVLLNENADNFSTIVTEYIKDKEKINEILKDYVPRKFDIYSGNRVQLEICKNGDFRPNLCFLNSKLKNHRPTVVTSYHNGKNKYTHEHYLKWAKNFLSIPFDLVVFTNKENISWIRELRGNLPLVLIEKNLEDFQHYNFFQKYKDIAELDNERNPNTGVKYHSAELYIIWNEKVKLVNQAIKENPYKSNFFIWCDIGTFREESYIKNNFTSDKLINSNKMTFVMNSEIDDQYYRNGYLIDIVLGAQGNLQIGDHRSWKVYDYLYNQIRDELLLKNETIGKDQTITSTMIMRYPNLFDLIYQDPKDHKNRWWYGLDHYSN